MAVAGSAVSAVAPGNAASVQLLLGRRFPAGELDPAGPAGALMSSPCSTICTRPAAPSSAPRSTTTARARWWSSAVAELHAFLDRLGIPRADQVIRPVARQGAAPAGVRLTRETLVPEVTVTAEGVYWHPVAAIDEHALITCQIHSIAPALDEASRLFAEHWAASSEATALFPCA